MSDKDYFFDCSLAALINGPSVLNGSAKDKNGCLSISTAFSLLSQSTSKQRAKKSLNTGDKFSGLCIFGVPFVAIKYSA